MSAGECYGRQEANGLDLLGGRVESSENRGSEFYFTLPYNPSDFKTMPPSSLATEESAVSFPDMIILIAEDDEVSRLLLLTSLKNANITTLSAVNGQEAVIMVEQHPEINLVLMDVKMPLMNGYEATTLIKKIRPDLPVIVQTAFTSKEERQKAQDAGCDGFITKPVNNDELFVLINKVLNN